MALQGNLRDFSITQLLNLVHLARKTGALTLQKDPVTTALFFREGKLVYTTSTDHDGHLVGMLARSGKLTADQAKMISNRSAGHSDKKLAMMLINAGTVTQKDIISSIRQDFLEIVYRLFTWSEGRFIFEPNRLADEDAITISIDLENVILEGSRHVKEWEHLQDELPDLDVALKFTDSPQSQLRNINLNVDEWRMISYISPRNSIRKIAQRIGMDDFRIRKITYGLLEAGLVEIVEPEREPVRPAPSKAVEKAVSHAPAVKRSVIHRLIDRIKRL
jgi:hypothetical protein